MGRLYVLFNIFPGEIGFLIGVALVIGLAALVLWGLGRILVENPVLGLVLGGFAYFVIC